MKYLTQNYFAQNLLVKTIFTRNFFQLVPNRQALHTSSFNICWLTE